MDQDKIREGLIDLFNATYGKRINKKSYVGDIQIIERQYSSLLLELADALNESDDNFEVIANILPEYASGQISEIDSKRKKSLQEVDYNMNMVCYFIPLIGTIRSNKSDALAARIVDLWNDKMPNSKIGVSTVANIDGGFKRGFCYISAAVCHSLQKSDDCYELTLLRDYRDNYLLSFEDGQKLVDEYYDIAPTIVNIINRDNGAAKIYDKIWNDYLNPCIKLIQDEKNEECRELYSEMVVNLEEMYLS